VRTQGFLPDGVIMPDGRPSWAHENQLVLLQARVRVAEEAAAQATSALKILGCVVAQMPMLDLNAQEWRVRIRNIDLLKHGMDVIYQPEKYAEVLSVPKESR